MDAGDLEAVIGNPWSVLPIKNNKYAKDLVEVHLSDRALTRLERFEDFPNLEVIWLNNNKVIKIFVLIFLQLRNLDEIQHNFRVKEVYCQKNNLEDVSGLRKFKFLTTLLIGDN